MLSKIHHHPKSSLTRLFLDIPEVLSRFFDALREALSAHREYERLRSRGVPHHVALPTALGIGHSACKCHAAKAGPREAATKPAAQGAFARIGSLSYVK
jgi:hypothetical protein